MEKIPLHTALVRARYILTVIVLITAMLCSSGCFLRKRDIADVQKSKLKLTIYLPQTYTKGVLSKINFDELYIMLTQKGLLVYDNIASITDWSSGYVSLYFDDIPPGKSEICAALSGNLVVSGQTLRLPAYVCEQPASINVRSNVVCSAVLEMVPNKPRLRVFADTWLMCPGASEGSAGLTLSSTQQALSRSFSKMPGSQHMGAYLSGGTLKATTAVLEAVLHNTSSATHLESEAVLELLPGIPMTVYLTGDDSGFLEYTVSYQKPLIEDSVTELYFCSQYFVAPGQLTSSMLESIETLCLSGLDVYTVIGLENCKSLKNLNISNTQVFDIWPLLYLDNLRTLNIVNIPGLYNSDSDVELVKSILQARGCVVTTY